MKQNSGNDEIRPIQTPNNLPIHRTQRHMSLGWQAARVLD